MLRSSDPCRIFYLFILFTSVAREGNLRPSGVHLAALSGNFLETGAECWGAGE